MPDCLEKRGASGRDEQQDNLPAILFYAFGSGLGHLNRTMAVVRKLLPLVDGSITVLTNSRYHNLYRECPIQYINSRALSEDECKRRIGEYLEGAALRMLVVDTFPRGIAGELADVLGRSDFKKILIRRILKDDYVEKFSIDAFISRHFDSVIHAEEIPGAPAPDAVCCPVLIRDYDELPGIEASRRLLNVEEGQKVILAAATGEEEELHQFHRMVLELFKELNPPGFSLRLVPQNPGLERDDRISSVSHFPLIEALPAADILIGPCGYNLFHESGALQIPRVFSPREKKYDDQRKRAGALGALNPEELRIRVEELIEYAAVRHRSPVSYRNRAVDAAQCIARRFNS